VFDRVAGYAIGASCNPCVLPGEIRLIETVFNIEAIAPGAATESGMEMSGEKHTRQLELALAYAESIIATLREPFVVLDSGLRVRTANSAFYRDFHASKEETG
jgi:hypothetical protein